jgi:hypothetical protein
VNSPFQQAISSLAALRQTVEKEMAAAEWALRSHADTEAPGFMQLAIADVAAVELMAARDIRLIVPATAAARAAYEVVVTCAWMLASADLAERDRRWMALFLDERKYWQRIVVEAEERKDEQHIIDALKAEVSRVQAIIDAVEPQLKTAGLGKLEGLPIMELRLEEVDQAKNYVLYKTACQLVHPTTRMLAQVRDLHAAHSDEGPIATYTFRTTERNWIVALLLSAEAMTFGLDTLCHRLVPSRPMSDEAVNHFNAVMMAVQSMPLTPGPS